MKISLNLNKNEVRALLSIIDECYCRTGCIWPEYQHKKRIDCDTCAFTKAMDSLVEKINKEVEQYDIV